ncbi:MAG TPA: Xaa-Pro peptidase family protein [Anaerolineae bacterium]|nr:Xaa-Pro peptidase family protein [Anaerolineae bacterium]
MVDNKQLIQEKLAQAVEILNEFEIDAWVIFTRETFMLPDPIMDLLVGLNVTWQSAFIITRTGRKIAIVGYYDGDSVRGLDVYEVRTYHHGVGPALRETIEEINPQKIALNYSEMDVASDGLTFGMYRNLCRYLAGTPYIERFVSSERVIAALRGRKSDTEVARVRQAVASTAAIFDAVEAYVRPGMTQIEIAAFVKEQIESKGLDYAWDPKYNPIVTCGPNSGIGHAVPGNTVLERGHTLHLDLGVRENDYCSDIQRMWYVLKEGEESAPPDVERAFDVVLGAIKVGEKALKPGVLGWEVDKVAREFIVDNGYPEYMHAFGHLLGRSAHDGATVLAPRWEKYQGICDLPVEVGNIFTLELHVVVAGRGIMSLEEDVLVGEDEVIYLGEPQTELRYIR